jgi:hypothetical protein
MTVAATIDEAIEQIAKQGFATVTIGNQTVTMKSIKELREAAEYLNTATSKTRDGFGIRKQKIMPKYD